MDNSVLQQALLYSIKNGFSVIQIGKDKKPLFRWQEFQDRIASIKEIKSWYTHLPDTNVGIVTGKISGITVIDVEDGGDISKWPETFTVRTGGGGYHLYYKYQEGIRNGARICDLTDIRGDGGYVVAPPSLHQSGNRYEVVKDIPMVDFPVEILRSIQKERDKLNHQEGSKSQIQNLLSGVDSGSRNEAAARMSGIILKIVKREEYNTTGWQLLVSWNRGNNPPLDEKELSTTYQSIAKREFSKIGLEAEGETDIVHISEAVTSEDYSPPTPIGFDVLDQEMKGGVREGDLVIITGKSGEGKCLAKGTKILMFNGSLKAVEDIKIGDKIMGDDNKPRNILSLTHGEEEMFDIIPTKGEKYTVNRSHILSLYDNGKKTINDISVNDYLKQSETFKNLNVGYKVGIDFPFKKVEVDPYFLGLWLGDGTSEGTGVTTADKEIIEYISSYADKIGNKVSIIEQQNNKSNVYSIVRPKNLPPKDEVTIRNGKRYSYKNKRSLSSYANVDSLRSKMKDINVINNKHIPDIYKINSRDIRKRLLAGIIDSDGYLNNNCWNICLKNTKLVDDIVFLVRSLGIGCHLSKSKFVNGKEYKKISIYGELSDIPVLLERKRCSKRKQIKNPLHYGIKVKSIGIGEYYGFEIDGNKRFVLGDFTVTHNTSIAQNISLNLYFSGGLSLWFSYEVINNNLYAKFKQMSKSMNLNVKDMPIFLPKRNASGNMSWIRSKIIESIEKYNTKFIFIDHIDFVSPTNLKNGDQRRMVLRDICQELKELAIELKITVFLIAHVKKVQDREIEMQDIAESSGIYQLADFVFSVQRIYKKEKKDGILMNILTDESTIKILKNRINGSYPSMKFIMADNVVKSLTNY